MKKAQVLFFKQIVSLRSLRRSLYRESFPHTSVCDPKVVCELSVSHNTYQNTSLVC